MKLEKILRDVTKPARYTGGEFGQVIKDKTKIDARVAFCFPDTYEIGMSNLGVKILCDGLNRIDNIWCERTFSPWDDMEKLMRQNDIPLFTLESFDPVNSFDILAFTLQYELSYTNILNALDLAKIPLLACDRDENHPIVIGGGPCAYNAEPIADYFDVFAIGEGEESFPEMVQLYISMKKSGSYSKEKYLHELAKIEGFYVPSFYNVTYNIDNTINNYTPIYDDIPKKIKKRIIKDMDSVVYPTKFIMPYIEAVHDRITAEIYRGCIRGCRFCQAGMIYRPVREKSPTTIDSQIKCLYQNTGYDEISLLSLSVSDYSRLTELTEMLLKWTNESKVNISLPSLRADTFTKELMDKISSVRQSGLTFAPEAGTARLRNAINKNVTEEEILNACRLAFSGGKSSVKLYFMMGLPTETYEDIEGIAQISKTVLDTYYKNPNRVKGGSPQVTLSCACFIPKPFTPFQWIGQNSIEELNEKQEHLKTKITDKKIRYNHHNAPYSRIEAAFARGDRRLNAVLMNAHKLGLKFDGWTEFFSYEKWEIAFAQANIDMGFYANRDIALDETLPWDIIDIGVTKEFLLSELEKSRVSIPTPNCKEKCHGCGANKLGGKATWCPHYQKT